MWPKGYLRSNANRNIGQICDQKSNQRAIIHAALNIFENVRNLFKFI